MQSASEYTSILFHRSFKYMGEFLLVYQNAKEIITYLGKVIVDTVFHMKLVLFTRLPQQDERTNFIVYLRQIGRRCQVQVSKTPKYFCFQL